MIDQSDGNRDVIQREAGQREAGQRETGQREVIQMPRLGFFGEQ